MDYSVSVGKGKNGKDYYMLKLVIGDFESEPLFISKLEYRYLLDYKNSQARADFKKGVEE